VRAALDGEAARIAEAGGAQATDINMVVLFV
jgi:hypothetical protein